MTIEFRCLHGSLQRPESWAAVTGRLDRHLRGLSTSYRAEDVLAVDARGEGPAGWARAYCSSIPVAGIGEARILLGYSLGGRLAWHALLECPRCWDAAVIVAGHPGDESSAERENSRRRDARWAARLRDEDLHAVLADWDAQPVFAGRPNPVPRSASSLSATGWAAAFEHLSRGNQADLRGALASATLPPVLYVSGELDTPYRALGDELARDVTTIRHVSIPGAGHRAPWERPEAFAEAVAGFLRLSLPEDLAGGGV